MLNSLKWAGALLLGLGIAAVAQADGGMVQFSGSIVAPTCDLKVQPAAGQSALLMQCEDGKPVRRVLGQQPVKSLNSYVAAVSLRPLSPRASVMEVEYR